MIKKKSLLAFIFGILILLLSVQTVSSALPVTTTQQFETGYAIEDSPQINLKQNESYQINFFIYNLSTTLPLDNASINCTYYLANNSGKVIFFGDVEYASEGYWSLNLLGTNFSYSGIYNYGINCNSTSFGGVATGYYEVSPTGIEPTESRTQTMTRSIYFLFIISIILFIGFLFVKTSPPVKWTFFLVSLMFFLQSITILYTGMIDEVINPIIEGYFSFLATASFILFWFAFGILAVMWFLTALQTLLFRKTQRNLQKFGGEK